MGINYNRSAGLALDADLVFVQMQCLTRISVRMQSCRNSHLKWSAELLRPAL